MRTKKPWIIAEWKKNSQEVIRVTIDSHKGKDVILIRTWYLDDEDKLPVGKARPTNSSIWQKSARP
jgi:hypothetical protein